MKQNTKTPKTVYIHSLLGNNLEYKKIKNTNIKAHTLYSYFCYTITKNYKVNYVSIFIA